MPIPICECVSVSVCVNDVLLFIVYDGRIQGRRKPRKDEFSQQKRSLSDSRLPLVPVIPSSCILHIPALMHPSYSSLSSLLIYILHILLHFLFLYIYPSYSSPYSSLLNFILHILLHLLFLYTSFIFFSIFSSQPSYSSPSSLLNFILHILLHLLFLYTSFIFCSIFSSFIHSS